MKKIELAKKSRKLFSAILAGAMLTTSVIPESFVWAADVEEVQGFGDSESMGFGSTPDPVTEDGEEGFTDEIASFGSNGSDTPVESGLQKNCRSGSMPFQLWKNLRTWQMVLRWKEAP